MRILSLDGGGYLGLATAAFIRSCERHFECRFHDKFDLFCGTSTGAIIALALALGLSGEEIVTLYKEFGRRVFPNSDKRTVKTWLLLKQFITPRYKNRELARALHDTFGDSTLGDIRKKGKYVLVPAFSVTLGSPRLFKTDHSETLSQHDHLRACDVALASSAAPVYFPLVRLQDAGAGPTEDFCDGGVAANMPALLGLAEALYELQTDPAQVELLSISTPRQDLATLQANKHSLNRGVLSWGRSLASILIDANSMVNETALSRIIERFPDPGPTYERVHLRNDDQLLMDSASESATAALERNGERAASLQTMRQRIAPFLRD